MKDQQVVATTEEFASELSQNVTADDFVFEQLEDRIVPLSGGCVTSSSCNCSSSSCIITA
ncbi:MAG TPA: hypothetical protein VH325_00380 [Bryobacteraceae bacterium]|nr:hypothetical protein [Bryobacteraceae bacterium]